MKQKLFVDTNFLFASFNPEDSLHKKAIQLKPLVKNFRPVLSNFVLLELYTLLAQRVSKTVAIDFGESIKRNHVFDTIFIDKALERHSWDVFRSIKDKNFSYVDASILAVLKHEKISHLLSFDHAFKQFEKNFKFTLIPA